MASVIDTHTHILDDLFFKDRKVLIKKINESELSGMIECGTDLEDSSKAVRLAHSNPIIYAAVGVHPHNAAKAPADYLETLRSLLMQDKVVAIGEIGLDYHYDYSPRDVQKSVFEEQLQMSLVLHKPMVIHLREATEDMMNILRRYSSLRGVLHCFSGSVETARECLNMGLYISFSGSITFKNAVHVREAAQAVPLDRLLAETDCPYMSPEPFRGKRNEPENVKYVLEKLARIKNISFEEMCEINERNAKALFGVKGKE